MLFLETSHYFWLTFSLDIFLYHSGLWNTCINAYLILQWFFSSLFTQPRFLFVLTAIKGGQMASRAYSKTDKDLPNYLQLYQHMTRSKLNCAETCNLNPLCDLYTFDSTVNRCILYEFNMNGNYVLCSGTDKCFIRHSSFMLLQRCQSTILTISFVYLSLSL